LPERLLYLDRHFLLASVEVVSSVANLPPARVPPFKGVLLTQEASLSHPDGLGASALAPDWLLAGSERKPKSAVVAEFGTSMLNAASGIRFQPLKITSEGSDRSKVCRHPQRL